MPLGMPGTNVDTACAAFGMPFLARPVLVMEELQDAVKETNILGEYLQSGPYCVDLRVSSGYRPFVRATVESKIR